MDNTSKNLKQTKKSEDMRKENKKLVYSLLEALISAKIPSTSNT